MKRIIALTFAAILICAAIVPASAERRTKYTPEPEPEPEKVLCTATIDDDFNDAAVILVMRREASRELLDYTPADFPEIDCINVDDLMPYTLAEYRETAANGGQVPYFNRLLVLTLAEGGKQNVLDSIKLLEQREDVLCAEPDYVDYPAEEDMFMEDDKFMIDTMETVGDIDQDGKVNARDVTGLMNFIIRGTSADELPIGDVNGDAKLNSLDVISLMKNIVSGK